MNIGIILDAACATLALGALIAAFVTLRSVRRWRGQCAALESSLAALRRETELIASISVRTGRRVQRVASEFSGVSERVELFEARAARVRRRSIRRSNWRAAASARTGSSSNSA